MIFNKTVIDARHVTMAQGWSNHVFTPDIVELEQHERQLLFVCDDWMSDRKNSQLLKEEPDYLLRSKSAFTYNGYRFYNYSAYGMKATVPLIGLIHSRRIMGEVVSLRPHSFLLLDRLRMNGIQYTRRRVHLYVSWRDEITFENTTEERRPIWPPSIIGIDRQTGKFPDGHPLAGKKKWVSREHVKIISAWMYLGDWRYWSYPYRSNIAAFHEIPRFHPKKDKRWLSEYYKYQNTV